MTPTFIIRAAHARPLFWRNAWRLGLPAAALVASLLSSATTARATTAGTIVTVAGNGQSILTADGGPATQALLNYPFGIVADGKGNVYFSERSANRVRKVAPDGTITTVAGSGVGGFSGDGGPATQSGIWAPTGLAMDRAGNLYICDAGRVRKVTPDGVISTVAGDVPARDAHGSAADTGDGGPAIQASLAAPKSLAFDAAGNMYIGEFEAIRKVDTNGIITTYQSGLGSVIGLAFDSAGNLYFSDELRNEVRKIAPDGTISRVAYEPIPQGIAIDAAGDLFYCDASQARVRKVAPDGTTTTVVGTGTPGFTADQGVANEMKIRDPSGVAVDAAGNLFVTDGSGLVWKATPDGMMTLLAGGGPLDLGDGGPADRATLIPGGLAFDPKGDLFVADGNNRIREITPDGVIHTVAGDGPLPWTGGYAGDGGPATSAWFHAPDGLALDLQGNLYVSDFLNNRVRRIDPSGIITTVAGNGYRGKTRDNVSAAYTPVNAPQGLAVGPDGSLLIAATLDNEVRRVDSAGKITDFASVPKPYAVTAAVDGSIYATSGGTVERLNADGTTTVIAGGGSPPDGGGDGLPATDVALQGVSGIAADGAGDLFVTDFIAGRVREITPDGLIHTVAGGGSPADGLGDGGPATAARLVGPYDLAIDPAGNLFISDTSGNRIREVFGAAAPGLFDGRPFPAPAPLPGDVNGDGKVTVGDATLALRFALDLAQPTPAQEAAADVDGSGKVTVADATLILRKALGL